MYLVLTTHIPHSEADVLVLHSLHIESCRVLNQPLIALAAFKPSKQAETVLSFDEAKAI